MKDEASYTCDSCGEEIVVPVDLTAGSRQEYIEDCPVCCCPNVIHVEIDEDGKYVASCPALQACYTHGDTFEEAMANIRDVVAMCLNELGEEKETVDLRYPEVIGMRQIEVTV